MLHFDESSERNQAKQSVELSDPCLKPYLFLLSETNGNNVG